MRRLLPLLLATLAVAALAEEVRLGQVSSTSGASATYSGLAPGNQVALSCDGAIRYRLCDPTPLATDGGDARFPDAGLQVPCVAVTTDAYVPGDKKLFDVCVNQGHTRMAIIPDTGSATTTCQLYRVNPVTYCKQ